MKIQFTFFVAGVIGAIDGCHIKILAPKDFPNSYYNRKKFHSVLLQGVCNKDKMFLDVYAGEPGSIHDANLFRKSDLYEFLSNTELYGDSHIIGDLAYPLSKNVMVGFKDLGNLGPVEKHFNLKLSEIRVVIEHAFAQLKGRFRRLKYMETRRLDLICLIIVASCILHNICILNNDIFDIDPLEGENNEAEPFEPVIANRRNIERQEGETKRSRIANFLYQNRNGH